MFVSACTLFPDPTSRAKAELTTVGAGNLVCLREPVRLTLYRRRAYDCCCRCLKDLEQVALLTPGNAADCIRTSFPTDVTATAVTAFL